MAMAVGANVNNKINIFPKAASYDQLFFTLQPPQAPKVNIGDVDLLGSDDILQQEVYNYSCIYVRREFRRSRRIFHRGLCSMVYVPLLPPVKYWHTIDKINTL